MADDDIDDQYLIKQAFNTLKLNVEIMAVNDGVELLNYLNQGDTYASKERELPKRILLDLNMPKKDGRECLKEIKADARFVKIPIVVYSTSNHPDDILFAYQQGASSYITKPYSYKELVEVMDTVVKYWFNVVKTPFTDL